jgi:hypothetical protein
MGGEHVEKIDTLGALKAKPSSLGDRPSFGPKLHDT